MHRFYDSSGAFVLYLYRFSLQCSRFDIYVSINRWLYISWILMTDDDIDCVCGTDLLFYFSPMNSVNMQSARTWQPLSVGDLSI